jgi:hypothetical protein
VSFLEQLRPVFLPFRRRKEIHRQGKKYKSEKILLSIFTEIVLCQEIEIIGFFGKELRCETSAKSDN